MNTPSATRIRLLLFFVLLLAGNTVFKSGAYASFFIHHNATSAITGQMQLSAMPHHMYYRHEYTFRDVMCFATGLLGLMMLVFGFFHVALYISFTAGALMSGFGVPFVLGSSVMAVTSIILGANRDTGLSRTGITLALINAGTLLALVMGMRFVNAIAGKTRR